VRWGSVAEQLALDRGGARTRRLRAVIERLHAEGALRQSRRHGNNVLALTAAGRDRLACAARAGSLPGLPESPHHRAWREARAGAGAEIDGVRELVARTLEDAGVLFASGGGTAEQWRSLARRLHGDCVRLATAIYRLYEQPEPDDVVVVEDVSARRRAASRGFSGWSENLTGRLVAMREAGLPNGEIAGELGVPLDVLQAQIGKLIRQGAVTSRRGLLWSHPDAWQAGRERSRRDVATAVERLYREQRSHREIARALNLTTTQLFAAGLPRRPRRTLSDSQVREIHTAYLGGGSIERLSANIGFTSTAVRRRMKQLGLPLKSGVRSLVDES